MYKTIALHNYSKNYNAVIPGIGAVRAQLARVLRSLDMVGWSTQEESGRLDRKAFARFATGSANIFSRRELKEAETAAVSVLIDCSLSMCLDGRIETAAVAATQLAKLFDAAGASFAVTGFRGSANKREEQVTFIPFKSWGETLRKAAPKMGAIANMAGDGTPDYSAIYMTLQELSQRPETRKVLFVLTDADGYNRPHMQSLQAYADKRGIKLVAIGIGETDVDRCFTNATNIKNQSELGGAAFRKILSAIKERA